MLLFVVLSDIFADQWLEDKLSNDYFYFEQLGLSFAKTLSNFEGGMSYQHGDLHK